jgi:hypothetical protein
MEEERRKIPRKTIKWPVNIVVDDEVIAGETVDITLEGIHITCDDPIPLNEMLSMTIAPPGKALIKVSARVIWSDLDGIDSENRVVGMGACFVEIPDDDYELFEEALLKKLE